MRSVKNSTRKAECWQPSLGFLRRRFQRTGFHSRHMLKRRARRVLSAWTCCRGRWLTRFCPGLVRGSIRRGGIVRSPRRGCRCVSARNLNCLSDQKRSGPSTLPVADFRQFIGVCPAAFASWVPISRQKLGSRAEALACSRVPAIDSGLGTACFRLDEDFSRTKRTELAERFRTYFSVVASLREALRREPPIRLRGRAGESRDRRAYTSSRRSTLLLPCDAGRHARPFPAASPIRRPVHAPRSEEHTSE